MNDEIAFSQEVYGKVIGVLLQERKGAKTHHDVHGTFPLTPATLFL